MELYRYIPFETFADIVANKQLNLVSPAYWEDTYEGWFWNTLVENGKPEQSQMVKEFRNCVFAQCWSKNKDSVALWSIYSYNQKAIMIESSWEKLKTLPNVIIKEIEYSEKAEINVDELYQILFHQSKDNLVLPYTKKRSGFAHENEVRLFVVNKNFNGEKKSYTIQIENPSDIITNVLVHPFAQDWYVEIIERFCNTFNIPFGGKSDLYDIHKGHATINV